MVVEVEEVVEEVEVVEVVEGVEGVGGGELDVEEMEVKKVVEAMVAEGGGGGWRAEAEAEAKAEAEGGGRRAEAEAEGGRSPWRCTRSTGRRRCRGRRRARSARTSRPGSGRSHPVARRRGRAQLQPEGGVVSLWAGAASAGVSAHVRRGGWTARLQCRRVEYLVGHGGDLARHLSRAA